MKTYPLAAHPAAPPNQVSAVAVEWRSSAEGVSLTYVISGAENLVVAAPSLPERTDDLWKSTCVELFWKLPGGDAYSEFNFSPSSRWAAYALDGYRSNMRDLAVASAPRIRAAREHGVCHISVDLESSILPPFPAEVALCAVIEETDGTKSYWALRHPPGKPDFHHPDCFALRIPALA